MNTRLKQLRQAAGLTQQEFAAKIGMKQNTVATYEMGRGKPSGRAIRDICRTFHASESWLRTGEGEMFVPASGEEEVADFVGRALNGEENGFPLRLLQALSRLTPAQWRALEQFCRELGDT